MRSLWIKKKKPIGFLDSGLGGLSVMKEAIKIMPNENYILFWRFKKCTIWS